MVEDYGEVGGHDVLISCCRSDGDFVESDPVLWIFLAVVFFEFFKFEIAGPHDLAEV